jgi:hypothetical protein
MGRATHARSSVSPLLSSAFSHCSYVKRRNIVANERYEHELWTGSGFINAILQFQESGDVECELQKRWMGSGEYHYRLSGSYEHLSDTCGRIFIRKVSVQQQLDWSSPSAPLSEIQEEEVPLVDLKADLMYEYIKVVRSPVLDHPDGDLPYMATFGYAGWNRFFDIILITSPYVMQCYESLKFLRNEESSTTSSSLEMPEGPDRRDASSQTPYAPNDSVLEQYGHLLYDLDKMKFAKMTEDSPLEMLDATDERAVEQLARFIFSPPAGSQDEG